MPTTPQHLQTDGEIIASVTGALLGGKPKPKLHRTRCHGCGRPSKRIYCTTCRPGKGQA